MINGAPAMQEVSIIGLGPAEVDAAVDVPGLYGAAVNGAGDDIGRITVCLEIRLNFRPEACQPFLEFSVATNMATEEGNELILCHCVTRKF